MKKDIDPVRDTALRLLLGMEDRRSQSKFQPGNYLDDAGFGSLDRAFASELVFGVVKWKLTLDWIIAQFSRLPAGRISVPILNILRIGVLQMLFMDRVPPSAACNECVRLAKKYGNPGSVSYVNAILRKISANRHLITYPDKDKDLSGYLSLRYSHPLWLVREWLEEFGQDFTEQFLEFNNIGASFTVRINIKSANRQNLIDMLNSEGAGASPGRYADEAILIDKPSVFYKTSFYAEGRYYIQDEASMLVSKLLSPLPGNLAIDVCSAPGGKTTHIAELMGNRGRIIARDIHEDRLGLVKQNADRLCVDIIEYEVKDATQSDERYRNKADRVLVDVPCTGYGVLRKKPEIKWNRRPGDSNELGKLQLRILHTASEQLKPGGLLVYSTCTVGAIENEDVVRSFLNNNKAFRISGFEDELPAALRVKKACDSGMLHLYPNIDGTDGFFIARFTKEDVYEQPA